MRKIQKQIREAYARRSAVKKLAGGIFGLFGLGVNRAFAQEEANTENGKLSVPIITDVLLTCPALPLGDYVTVVPSDPCQSFSYAGASSTLTRVGSDLYQLSDMDIGYFFGDYVVQGNFRVGHDCETLTLEQTPGTPYGIQWRGTGKFFPKGGIHGKGRIEFTCYYDATYAGSGATESIWFDKV